MLLKMFNFTSQFAYVVMGA